MTTVAERLTADAYLAREDPRRTELIDGVVVVNEPSPLLPGFAAAVGELIPAAG